MECMPESWDLDYFVILPTCLDGSDRNLSLGVSELDITSFAIQPFDFDSQKGHTKRPYNYGSRVYFGFSTIRGDIESISEEECIKRQGFTCEKANTKVCLNSNLRCNEHPDCDDASDEEGCEEKNPLGGFRCPSPHHNKENKATFTPWVTIFATRCDLHPECWGGVDEQGCNNDWAVYYVIGKTFLYV